MSPLAWLAIPLLSVLVAVAVVTWAGRSKPRAEMRKSVRRHQRFQAAFASRDRDQRWRPR